MCGIAGYFLPAGEPSPLLDRLTRARSALRHRGPDGEGSWVSPDRRVGLTHTRLAVIDREGGAQPMVDPRTGLVVVANGEIYNYREIEEALEARVGPPRTRSDTESLLLGFSVLGEDVLPQLRGMFAFAAYDPRSGVLTLARDRLGQKPLYHASLAGDGIVFASELPALLALLGKSPEPDEEALSIYLSFGYVPAPRTAYAGVAKLPAAHVISTDRPTPRRWWRRPPPDPQSPTPREAEELLLDGLRDAVRTRLISDVPLGAFLSGGIDSTTVVSLMAEESGRPVRTFTAVHDDPEYDESSAARAVAERCGTEHTEIRIDPPSVEEIPELLARYGEPFGDSSAIAAALLSRAARRHVTVALTGDGGDEAFGGYDRFRILRQVQRVPRWFAKAARRVTGGTTRRALDLAARSPSERYYEFYESFNAGARESLLSPRLHRAHGQASLAYLESLYESFSGGELDRMLATDSSTWLPDDLNVKVDVASMSVALECRSPFEDHLVVEAAARLPARMHLAGGRGKALLRAAMKDRLPPEVLEGTKKGFAVPVERWFQGDLDGFLASKLRSPALRRLDLVRPEAVEEVLASLSLPRRHGRPRIQAFLLLSLALWAERR